MSILPSIAILGPVLIATLYLASARDFSQEKTKETVAASHVLTVTTGIQGIHFIEEAVTGFHERLPMLFGLPSMPLTIFVGFNLSWLVLWAWSANGIRHSYRVAYFAAWFLAIGGLINGLVHPLFAVLASGYFPGLITSPFIGIAGIYLSRKLYLATV